MFEVFNQIIAAVGSGMTLPIAIRGAPLPRALISCGCCATPISSISRAT
jgi:hypothetical protein